MLQRAKEVGGHLTQLKNDRLPVCLRALQRRGHRESALHSVGKIAGIFLELVSWNSSIGVSEQERLAMTRHWFRAEK